MYNSTPLITSIIPIAYISSILTLEDYVIITNRLIYYTVITLLSVDNS